MIDITQVVAVFKAGRLVWGSPMAKRKRRDLPSRAYVTYVVQITDFDWSYSFGLDSASYDDRRYSDFRRLQIRGSVLPAELKLRAPSADLTFLPIFALSIWRNAGIRARALSVLCIGRTERWPIAYLWLRKLSTLSCACCSPDGSDTSSSTERRYAIVNRYCRLETTLDPDDYPDVFAA
jgi:hypothetical protein